jgi:hypothetical protein
MLDLSCEDLNYLAWMLDNKKKTQEYKSSPGFDWSRIMIDGLSKKVKEEILRMNREYAAG